MNRLSMFTLAFAGANASLLNKRQAYTTDAHNDFSEHLDNVCYTAHDNDRDMTLPCNQIMVIQAECMYGPEQGKAARNEFQRTSPEEPTMLPFEAQRVCICQSQHTDIMKGCSDCNKAHGGLEGEDWISNSKIQEFMDKYCDVGYTPTDSYSDFIFKEIGEEEDMDSTSTAATTYSDPVGTSTDVSLYFTPAVTGSSAWEPALTTGSVGNITYTSTRTSDGQIVPTASGMKQQQSSGGDEASRSGSESDSDSSETASSDSGALQTAMAHPGALGALGLAAMIAAL